MIDMREDTFYAWPTLLPCLPCALHVCVPSLRIDDILFCALMCKQNTKSTISPHIALLCQTKTNTDTRRVPPAVRQPRGEDDRGARHDGHARLQYVSHAGHPTLRSRV